MGATKTIITSDIAFVGMRVCRGLHWQWENQDHVDGKEVPGKITILGVSGKEWVQVQWDGGSNYAYCVGGTYGYGLYLWEDEVDTAKAKPEELTSTKGLQIGDEIYCFQVPGDEKAYSHLTVGEWVQITEINSNGTHLKTAKSSDWWVRIHCFNASRQSTKAIPLKTDQVLVGDEVCFYQHLSDSYSSHLSIGQWVKVTEVSRSYGITTEARPGWWVKIECFNEVRKAAAPKKVAQGMSYTEAETLGKGDIVSFVDFTHNPTSAAELGLCLNGHYYVERISFSKSFIKLQLHGAAGDTWFDIRSFRLEQKKKVEEVREALAKAVQVVKISGNTADWGSRKPVLDEKIVCIKLGDKMAENRVKVGDVIEVRYICTWAPQVAGAGHGDYMKLECFVPLNQGGPWLSKSDSSFSLTIKPNKNDKHTSGSVSRNRRDSGDAVKIQRTSLKIARQKEGGGSRVSVGTGKARVAR